MTVPVIVLTARDSVRDTVAGLEGGADDWMTKPFRFEELLARVRLRLRTAARAPEVTMLRSGSLTLDLRTRRARAGERTVELTAREFVLLELFLRHPGQVLSREQTAPRRTPAYGGSWSAVVTPVRPTGAPARSRHSVSGCWTPTASNSRTEDVS